MASGRVAAPTAASRPVCVRDEEAPAAMGGETGGSLLLPREEPASESMELAAAGKLFGRLSRDGWKEIAAYLRRKSMRSRVLRSAWGLTGLRTDARRALAGVREAGFDGLEASLSDIGSTSEERRNFVAAAQAEDLSLILSAYSSWPNYEGDFESIPLDAHLSNLSSEFREIAALHTSLPAGSPIIGVNAHSGSDAWTESENVDFFARALEASDGCELPNVSHETHRARALCCPFVTARLLAAVPRLRLTSDFSHWVLKCERLLDAPAEAALLRDTIAPAVDHLHARIGTPQQPQVADVEAASVRGAAERFYSFWTEVWTAAQRRSLSRRDFTATVEYGPVELSDAGEYVGYTPVDAALQPVARRPHDETLRASADALRARFEPGTPTCRRRSSSCSSRVRSQNRYQ